MKHALNHYGMPCSRSMVSPKKDLVFQGFQLLSSVSLRLRCCAAELKLQLLGELRIDEQLGSTSPDT